MVAKKRTVAEEGLAENMAISLSKLQREENQALRSESDGRSGVDICIITETAPIASYVWITNRRAVARRFPFPIL